MWGLCDLNHDPTRLFFHLCMLYMDTRPRWLKKKKKKLACSLYSASDSYRKVYMICFYLRRCLDPPPTMAKCDAFIKENWPKLDQNHILALIFDTLVKTLWRLQYIAILVYFCCLFSRQPSLILTRPCSNLVQTE